MTETAIVLAIAWCVAELRLLLYQRHVNVRMTELLDRVQAGTLSDFKRHERRPLQSRPGALGPGEPELVQAEAPVVDVAGARAAYRALSEAE